MAQDVEPQTLRLVRRSLVIAGKSVDAFGIEGAANAGFLRGGPFMTRVENQLKVPALLHWHGLHAPVGSDGSSPPEGLIEPGASVTYDFPVTRSGTHMMRAANGLLQQQLLAAPLIVRDIDGPIESTVDLRRSLRAQFPTLSVSERGGRFSVKDHVDESPDFPQAPPVPYKAPTVRVLLTKIPGMNSLGFSNMASQGSGGLVVTRIIPGGLLSQAVPKIRVGDTIESVNKVTGDLDRMRRELLMADRLVLDVSLTSFNMVV
jgi:hypothetical protein